MKKRERDSEREMQRDSINVNRKRERVCLGLWRLSSLDIKRREMRESEELVQRQGQRER